MIDPTVEAEAVKSVPALQPGTRRITSRTRNFWLPKQLMKNQGLFTLSHVALKMFVFIAHRMHSRGTQQVQLTDSEASYAFSILREEVPGIRGELVDAKLIEFNAPNKTYQFVQDNFSSHSFVAREFTSTDPARRFAYRQDDEVVPNLNPNHWWDTAVSSKQ